MGKKSALGDLPAAAAHLQRMGRNGDTILAHINPYEAAALKRMGGAGTVNPHSGLLEFHTGGDNGPGPGDEGPSGEGFGGGMSDGPGSGGGFEGGFTFNGPGPLDLSPVGPSFSGPADITLGRDPKGKYSGDGRGGPVNGGLFNSPAAAQRELMSVGRYGSNYKNLDALQRADISLSGALSRNIGNPSSSFVSKAINTVVGAVPVLGALNTIAGLPGINYSVGDLMTEDMSPESLGNGITGTLGTHSSGLAGFGNFSSDERGATAGRDAFGTRSEDYGGEGGDPFWKTGGNGSGNGNAEDVAPTTPTKDEALGDLYNIIFNPYLGDYATYGHRPEHQWFMPGPLPEDEA